MQKQTEFGYAEIFTTLAYGHPSLEGEQFLGAISIGAAKKWYIKNVAKNPPFKCSIHITKIITVFARQ